MVYLPDLQRQAAQRAERAHRAYLEVCKVKARETRDDRWRREQAGLTWWQDCDYMLESKGYLENCIFDGARLKESGREGQVNAINAGFRLGFNIPPGIPGFVLYAMSLNEEHRTLCQCPKCKVLYSIPSKVDVLALRKQKEPEPMVFGKGR